MSLRFPKVQPSWAYRDPAEFVQFSASITPYGIPYLTDDRKVATPPEPVIDRYHRAARRLHVKQLQKGKV